jgi:hypothetical protein
MSTSAACRAEPAPARPRCLQGHLAVATRPEGHLADIPRPADPGCTAPTAADILTRARIREDEGVESPFVGHSEMARRMREVDWAGTTLGPPQH